MMCKWLYSQQSLPVRPERRCEAPKSKDELRRITLRLRPLRGLRSERTEKNESPNTAIINKILSITLYNHREWKCKPHHGPSTIRGEK